jgi:hypothetical protein
MFYRNPDLYDALLPVSGEQLNFYMTLAQRQTGAILELACGSGQLTVPIAAQGMPVVGLDSLEGMELTGQNGTALARERGRAAPFRQLMPNVRWTGLRSKHLRLKGTSGRQNNRSCRPFRASRVRTVFISTASIATSRSTCTCDEAEPSASSGFARYRSPGTMDSQRGS